MVEHYIAERGPDIVLVVLAVTVSAITVAIWATLVSNVHGRGGLRNVSVGWGWAAWAAALWTAWVLVR